MGDPSNIEIVPAQPGDARAMQELRYKTWLATYPNTELGITVEDIEDRFKDRLSDTKLQSWEKTIADRTGEKAVLVAKHNGVVIGFCLVRKLADKNQLGAIYVLPEYQSRGIGTMLWDKARPLLDPKKETIVELATYNTIAIAFYEKVGFVDSGKRSQNEEYRMKSGSIIPEMEMVLKAR